MKIAVCGLWHLGRVFASVMQEQGHHVIAYDDPIPTDAPVEPDLQEVITTNDPRVALHEAQVVWIAWDTPLGEDDVGDVEWVKAQARKLYPLLPRGCTVIVSSQVPVGTTETMQTECNRPDTNWSYIPENLRLGTAVRGWHDQARVTIGGSLKAMPIFRDKDIVPMSIRSAEMAKHAVNAHLAAQIALTNEIGWLCETVGADARDVEKAVRAEPRIGYRPYVHAGAPFAGGTLGRDLEYLKQLQGYQAEDQFCLAAHIKLSNDSHLAWLEMNVEGCQHVAVWGLTYKGSTTTLRRSKMERFVEILLAEGVYVRALDAHQSRENMIAAIDGADALVLGNEHANYRTVTPDQLIAMMRRPLVIDPGGYLHITDPRIDYRQVGVPRG